jgi:hypothetical protein
MPIFSSFNQSRFSQQISVNVFSRICPVGAEFLNPDRRADTSMTKLIVAFRYSENSPKE